MRIIGNEPCPLPEHPALAEFATAIDSARTWGYIVDAQWRLVYMSDDNRLSNGRLQEFVPIQLGEHLFSEAALENLLAWSGRVFDVASWVAALRGVAQWVIEDTPGGYDAVADIVDPRLRHALGESGRIGETAMNLVLPARTPWGEPIELDATVLRVRDDAGALAGTAFLPKPRVPMSVMGTITGAGDLGHFERMQRLARLARRPAAILFADLEGSSALARRLSTASYFALGRRIVRAADRAVVDAGGMVGRHAGDGVVAFFLAEGAGSESRAARACIAAGRDIRAQIDSVAESSGLPADAVVLRFGLHWGATLHIGHVVTPARAEVNALGDEMNEAARIEACATGGRILASKALMERLDAPDADALGLEPHRLAYTALGELPTATEKARRDAPAIAVCEL